MFGVLSVVSKRFRAVGLIYQQSVEGDSRDPENKKNRSRREEIPRVKSDGGSRNGPKVEGFGCGAVRQHFLRRLGIRRNRTN